MVDLVIRTAEVLEQLLVESKQGDAQTLYRGFNHSAMRDLLIEDLQLYIGNPLLLSRKATMSLKLRAFVALYKHLPAVLDLLEANAELSKDSYIPQQSAEYLVATGETASTVAVKLTDKDQMQILITGFQKSVIEFGWSYCFLKALHDKEIDRRIEQINSIVPVLLKRTKFGNSDFNYYLAGYGFTPTLVDSLYKIDYLYELYKARNLSDPTEAFMAGLEASLYSTYPPV